jgi:hypothetical protein
MMYAVPLDDRTVAVGDVRAGLALLGDTPLSLDDATLQARRFDRAAELLAAHGFEVARIPALVLAGGGSFVTYTTRSSIALPRAGPSSTCPPTSSRRSIRPAAPSTRRAASRSIPSTSAPSTG